MAIVLPCHLEPGEGGAPTPFQGCLEKEAGFEQSPVLSVVEHGIPDSESASPWLLAASFLAHVSMIFAPLWLLCLPPEQQHQAPRNTQLTDTSEKFWAWASISPQLQYPPPEICIITQQTTPPPVIVASPECEFKS